MKDLKFTQPKTMEIAPDIKGKTTVDGLILYQKLLTLILSPSNGAYREQAGTTLTQLLQGANTPQDDVLLAIGTNACSTARNLLAVQDSDLIDSLEAAAQDGSLTITLTLTDGQTYTGALAT